MSNNNKTKGKLSKNRDVPGLLECAFEYTVVDTKASFKWTGPKITRQVWDEVLSFFKWTYDEDKSESQVRLYVNHRLGVWKAWAYPQEAKTGMAARELTDPWGPEQFVFSDDDGWLLFGTVHHHCSADAFQSSTDEANERNQPGLHITVGNMDKLQHSIHARLYIDGMELGAMKLSQFWNVNGTISALPQMIQDLLPADAFDKVAKKQMGEHPVPDVEFPEQWKRNVIYKKPEVVLPKVYQPTHHHASWNNGFKRHYIGRSETAQPFDLNRCYNELKNWMEAQDDKDGAPEVKWDWEQMNQLLFEMIGKFTDEELEVLDILMRNDLLIEKFSEYLEAEMEDDDKKQAEAELKKMQGTDKSPDLKQVGLDGLTDEERAVQEYYGGHGYR